MRKAISNATIITGDGETVLPDHTLVIEKGMVADIVPARFLAFDLAEDVIDAGGSVVMPGIINHHSHGSTIGPFNIFGEELPAGRVLYNLDRHMAHGTTTIVAACGWPTQAEAEATNNLHPINVRTGTLHAPHHLAHTEYIDGGGLKPWHKNTTVDEQIAQGAVYIGEVGVPCAAYGTPQICRELNRTLTVAQVQEIKEAALGPSVEPDAFDAPRMNAALKAAGLDDILDLESARDLMDRHMVAPYRMTIDCCEEFGDLALKHNIPLIFHNTPDTVDLCMELAPKLGPLLIALHCNYAFTPEEAVKGARELKRHGAIVDIFVGDEFGANMFTKSKDAGFAMLGEGLVDLISTDYIGGNWDPIPLILEKAMDEGHLTLPQAIKMTSKSVVDAIPRLGTHKATIAPGHPADLTIVDAKHMSQVKMVLIAGKTVARDRQVCVQSSL
jgi:predicted amidohydrolase